MQFLEQAKIKHFFQFLATMKAHNIYPFLTHCTKRKLVFVYSWSSVDCPVSNFKNHKFPPIQYHRIHIVCYECFNGHDYNIFIFSVKYEISANPFEKRPKEFRRISMVDIITIFYTIMYLVLSIVGVEEKSKTAYQM